MSAAIRTSATIARYPAAVTPKATSPITGPASRAARRCRSGSRSRRQGRKKLRLSFSDSLPRPQRGAQTAHRNTAQAAALCRRNHMVPCVGRDPIAPPPCPDGGQRPAQVAGEIGRGRPLIKNFCVAHGAHLMQIASAVSTANLFFRCDLQRGNITDILGAPLPSRVEAPPPPPRPRRLIALPGYTRL